MRATRVCRPARTVVRPTAARQTAAKSVTSTKPNSLRSLTKPTPQSLRPTVSKPTKTSSLFQTRRFYATTQTDGIKASVETRGIPVIKPVFEHAEQWSEEVNPFHGVSQESFAKDIADKLRQPAPEEDIEIRPDGIIYLPEIKYRRILNDAFGPGGWALVPRPNTALLTSGGYSREFALFCHGRYISQARGESQSNENDKQGFSLGKLDESSKSNALMRCCKDLGVASNLWDPKFINAWKSKFAQEGLYENNSGVKRRFWRRKDGPPMAYPWREASSGASQSRPTQQQQQTAATTASTSTSTQQKPAGGQQVEAVDIQGTVPALFKKYAGKKWIDTLSDSEGYSFFQWATTNMQPPARNVAQEALAAFEKRKTA